MQIREYVPFTRGYSIHGTFQEVTSEMVSVHFSNCDLAAESMPFPAAAVMYQRARKLGTLYDNPADFDALAELQLEAYVVSINALSLIDPASAWFVMPLTNGHDREVGHFHCDINLFNITKNFPSLGNERNYQCTYQKASMHSARRMRKLFNWPISSMSMHFWMHKWN